MDKQELAAELCRVLDEKALKVILLALESVRDTPDGYGSFEVFVAKREVANIQVHISLKP